MANVEAYTTAFQEAVAELEQLSAQRTGLLLQVQALNQRIRRVKHSLESLGGLIDRRIPPADSKGITDACQTVLREGVGSDYSAKNVRDELITRGWDLKKYRNPLAVIHTVLKRLAANKTCGVDARRRDGTAVYGFKPTMPAVDNLPVARTADVPESPPSLETAASAPKKPPRVIYETQIPTVAIKLGEGYCIINASDYDPDMHEPYEGPVRSFGFQW